MKALYLVLVSDNTKKNPWRIKRYIHFNCVDYLLKKHGISSCSKNFLRKILSVLAALEYSLRLGRFR